MPREDHPKTLGAWVEYRVVGDGEEAMAVACLRAVRKDSWERERVRAYAGILGKSQAVLVTDPQGNIQKVCGPTSLVDRVSKHLQISDSEGVGEEPGAVIGEPVETAVSDQPSVDSDG